MTDDIKVDDINKAFDEAKKRVWESAGYFRGLEAGREVALELLKEKQKLKVFKEHEYIVKCAEGGLQLMPDVMQELIRCKDCKHCEKDAFGEGSHYCKWGGLQVDGEFFCGNGERRADQ